MNGQPQDSFELFADTLTITLGCILFIALLLVTITRSHQLDQSSLVQFERRSELLERQINVAENSVKRAEASLKHAIGLTASGKARLEAYEAAAHAELDNFVEQNGPEYTKALAEENRRSRIFFAKYPWMLQAIQANTQSLDERIDRAFAEASSRQVALSVLHQKEIEAPNAIYMILKDERLYPVGTRTEDPPHVSWIPENKPEATHAAPTWQVVPKEHAGLDLKEAKQLLAQTADSVHRASGSQIVLLVYEDSFQLARKLLQELSRSDLYFSWRPLTMKQRALMSDEGLPPDAPF
ncbi:MAG: hypothetical protein ACLFU4_02445 [Opitutales bacterium]